MVIALPILDTQTIRPEFAQGPRSLGAVKLLRLSVTDRCNLRCVYCMPEDGVAFHDREDLLSADDIVAVARAAANIGIGHFKITGGEPTVRRDLVEIVEGLASLESGAAALPLPPGEGGDPGRSASRVRAPSDERVLDYATLHSAVDPLTPTLSQGERGPERIDLSMTTNGMLLDRMAGDLRRAGLQRLTLSWDSMKPERFDAITGGRYGSGALDQFRRGLDAALDAGFERLKINVVVMAGVNDDEVVDFARLTLKNPWTVRFIEYMPLGDSRLTHDDPDHYTLDNAVVMGRIEDALGPMTPADRASEAGVGPANVFTLPGARGRLGFISAMSRPFCETCNRLRLTAMGELRSCLFDGGEVSVLPALRPRPDLEQIVQAMRRCVVLKPETHSRHGNRAMSQLGG